MKILKSKLFWFVVILVAGAVWFFFGREKEVEYTLVTVETGNVIETVDVSASLEPDHSAEVSFESMGVVQELNVKEGDIVKKDQQLARLDNSIVYLQLKEARSRMAIVEEDEKNARRQWDDLDPEVRESKKLASQAARAQLAALSRQIYNRTITAPMTGVVSRVYVDVGETVAAISPIVRIISEEGMHLEASVPESDITSLKVGQMAEVTFDALDADDLLEARIAEIEPEATVIQDVVYYNVEFELLSQDKRLKSGMSADAIVEISRSENVLYIPRRAVHEDEDRKYVEILNNDIVEERTVKTGIDDDAGNVEILEGLRSGDEVIL